jgi:hypothetical protein
MKFKTAVLAAVMRHHDKLRLIRRALAWKPWNDVNSSEVSRKRNFAQRKFQGRPPYETSTWGLMLSNPRSQDSRQITWYLTSLDSLRKFFEDIILNVGFRQFLLF